MSRETGNLYEMLEVHPRASQSVITAAYKTLTTIFGGTQKTRFETTARRIDRAYETLSNPTKREEYDHELLQASGKSGKMVGPYRIIELIAEGGFGRTYKAEHSILGELVCIKDCSNVSSSQIHILIEEAKALWDLRHYALPTMRDLIRLDDGRVLLVMSYIPGLTLEKIIGKAGKLDPEHVTWIAERLLNALSYIHRNGVIHGDIKPSNIIVQTDKHMAVLVDFGLSMVKPTATSESKGHTPLYAAPEEIDGSPLLPESDFYSLGMTMLYALGGNEKLVAQKKVPVDTPKELCNFIHSLVAQDINGRPTWEKNDLCAEIAEVRQKAFGRRRSNMKTIKGV